MANTNLAEVFARPNTDAKIHDLEQFTLWTETPDKPGFRSRMTFGERNGAPRITVFTNQEPIKVVYVGMTPMVFEIFLEQLEKIARGEPGKALHIVNKDRAPGSDPKSDNPEMIVRNKLWYGKDNDGIVWLAVEQNNVKNTRFQLLPSPWHSFVKEGGVPLTAAEGSQLYTLALINAMRRAYTNWYGRIRPAYEKPDTKQKGKPNVATETAEPSMTSISTFDNDIQF